ncbi:MAG: tetratricopeptide repeat protein [Firmicutes bacterium]|uniref:Tetratricopeptide repeat-containing protein n=1 Tax=Melghirimyces thermohalophilus TaxID=1236220 RepID=A0A1G6I6W3_9BACL|nr:tetratricopeptide repeat protein [Melghirimyces thermohalophilus]MDA8354015.1 tetratricopeptide repeat protein [Bacillota bacterium]SDC02289.1 Tetratricopeptide repeat-containing protein [Melghirimyces thermohalophilus]
MGKIFIFSLLWYVLGNPLIALLILLVLFYILDRRFVGIFPSLTRPIQRNRQIRKLKQSLHLNPHHTSDRRELAHLYMEKKQYRKALAHFDQVRESMPESADVKADMGLCHLKLGHLEEGEKLLREALQTDPRVHYGDPYLRLGEAFSDRDRKKALAYLEQFGGINSSSSEAYYQLGRVYQALGQTEKSREAFQEAIEIYRSLPKYKKRSERAWALRSSFRLGLLPSPKKPK